MSRMKPWAWAGKYDDNAREVIRALSMGKSYRKFKGQHCQLAEQHKPTAPHNTFHNNRHGGGALHHDVIAIWREGNLSCQYWVLLECDWPPLLSLLFFFTPSVIVTMNVCYVRASLTITSSSAHRIVHSNAFTNIIDECCIKVMRDTFTWMCNGPRFERCREKEEWNNKEE